MVVRMTKIIGFLLIVIAGGLLAYSAAQHFKQDARVAALRDTVHVTDSVRSVVAETVRVKLAAKLRTDTLVQVLTDTQLVVRQSPAAKPETVTVLSPIIDRIASCDAFSSSCRVQLRADSNEITALKTLVTALKPPSRFGLSFVAGPACNQSGCDLRLGFGISYRIR